MINLCRSVAITAAVLALAGMPHLAAAQGSFANGGFDTTFPTTTDKGVTGSNTAPWFIGGTGGYPAVVDQTTANLSGGYTGNSTNIKLSNANNGGTLISASPAGGNFLEYENPNGSSYIYQTITGLTLNATYKLTFYQAGAVWADAPSPTATTDNWKVGFATTAANSILAANQQTSTTINTPADGFSGWTQQQMTLVATATQMVLSFMATGGPSSQPPFALLDGVTLTQTVPEPGSALLVLSALGGMIGLRRVRRRS